MLRSNKDSLDPNNPLSHTAVHVRATRCMWKTHNIKLSSTCGPGKATSNFGSHSERNYRDTVNTHLNKDENFMLT